MYVVGYSLKGPNFRLFGAVLANGPMFILLFATVGKLIGKFLLPDVDEWVCIATSVVVCLLVFSIRILWNVLLAILNKN